MRLDRKVRVVELKKSSGASIVGCRRVAAAARKADRQPKRRKAKAKA